MRYIRLLTVSTVTAATMAIATASAPSNRPDAAGSARAAEISRIRIHFDSALTALAARDLTDLTATQRAQRTSLVAVLRAYRDRGVFPVNYDFPGQAVPYFVDRKVGTLCAVAHLLASTGRRDIVDRVAKADNNVWVPELAGDSAFTRWLDANGLALAEAAHIQVPYVGDDPAPRFGSSPREADFRTAGSVALAGALATGAWNAFGNADGHRKVASFLGIASGLASAGIGVAIMTQPSNVSTTAGAVGTVIGGLSTALATRSLLHRSHSGKKSTGSLRNDPEATISPMVMAGNNAGAGLQLSIRF